MGRLYFHKITFGCLCNIRAISLKLAKAVFLLPTLATWTGAESRRYRAKVFSSKMTLTDLRRPHDELLLLSRHHVWVLIVHDPEHSLKVIVSHNKIARG